MRRPAEFQSFPDSIRCDYGPYMAVCRYVVDGDTLDALISVGFNDFVYRTLRLDGIDAPELRGDTKPAGLAAKAFLESLMPPGTPFQANTRKDPDSFGRYLVSPVLADGTWVCAAMVEAGHAVYWAP